VKFTQTSLEGLYLVEYQATGDGRGEFYRTFCQKEFSEMGVDFLVRQSNISITTHKGTIRGLHYQKEPVAEDKVVTCLSGCIFDVAVDVRKNSQTYGQWYAVELSEENKKALLIPKGFAHGFQALTDNVMMQYLMSQYYISKAALGLTWDDPVLNIEWPMEPTVISERDKRWPTLGEYTA
jgi:dTDP-4-dehydrorhamnose 3,5-epimerase